MIAVLLADGFEEIEALTPVDMLRRAGLDARTVAIGSKIAVGSHGIPVICDLEAKEVCENEISMLVLPGGMPGSLNLDASADTDRFINAVLKNGGRLAAICAAPLVLGRRGLLKDKEAICYPGFENELTGAKISKKAVVTDGNITTAKGMGVALEFAKELVALLCGEEKKNELGSAIMEK
ncbi:MAG: DJ-1/PfpI family protein [Clostridia bacterium]|nr:DJ-1/PfpI family protein [Clostridia bacterium]